MKTIFAMIVFFMCSCAWASPNPAEYTVNIHVVSSEVSANTNGRTPSIIGPQTLNVLIDGTKYELAAAPVSISLTKEGLIVPGDYKARLVSDKRKGTYAYTREYELLFPDGTTKKFAVIGQSE